MQLVHTLYAFQASVLSVLSPLSLVLYKQNHFSSLSLFIILSLSNSAASSWTPELHAVFYHSEVNPSDLLEPTWGCPALGWLFSSTLYILLMILENCQ